MSKISENVLKVLINNYKTQTKDNEDQIRGTIKRFQQLNDSLQKKVNDKNPIILKIIPTELIKNNHFKDVTKYPNYENLITLIQAISLKPIDPYKQIIEFYKKTNPYIDPRIIGNYVARFKLNLSQLIKKVEEKDKNTLRMIPTELLQRGLYQNVLSWRNFESLEHLLDSVFPLENDGNSLLYEFEEQDNDLVYSKDGIEIYKGDEEFKCIKYGKGYNWCIGRNMYSNYRYSQSKGHNRAFYFVFDKTQSSSSEYRAVVIHAYESGKWARTTALNNGDFPYGGGIWSSLEEGFKGIEAKKLWGKIKDLKNLFPFTNPKPHELRRLGLKNKKLTLEAFAEFDNELKTDWLRANASDRQIVTSDIVKSLPPFGDFSKNDLINHDKLFSYDELKGNIGLLKRYAVYRFTRHPDKPIPYHFIPYLIEPNKPDPLHLQRIYFNKFEENYLTYEIIERYFHIDILKYFIKKQIKIMSYIPKDAIKYMDEEGIKIFQKYYISYSDIEIYNGKFDEGSTEAPIQNAQVSIISTKSLLSFPKNNIIEFINLIKSIKVNENNQLFFLGTPILFEFNDKTYIITKHNKDLSNNNYDLIEGDTFKVIKEKFLSSDDGNIFYKNNSPLKLQTFIEKQIGKNSYIIQNHEYDSILISEGGKIDKNSKVLLKYFS